MEKHYFLYFRRTDVPKAPLRGFKSTPFACLRLFSAPWISAREWRWLRRLVKIVLLSFPIPISVIGFPTIDLPEFNLILSFLIEFLLLPKENMVLYRNSTELYEFSTRIACRRHVFWQVSFLTFCYVRRRSPTQLLFPWLRRT